MFAEGALHGDRLEVVLLPGHAVGDGQRVAALDLPMAQEAVAELQRKRRGGGLGENGSGSGRGREKMTAFYGRQCYHNAGALRPAWINVSVLWSGRSALSRCLRW